MSGRDLYLGVDGGGTKTAFVCIDSAGVVVARAVTGTTYHLQVGLAEATRRLADGVAAICRDLAIDPSGLAFTFFGLPAFGEDDAVDPHVDEACGGILAHRRYACGNDMICGWAGSLACADGINLVAGTGSIGYGERRGVAARAGGWGEMFGDEGSAYWIAIQGLAAFTRMSDGRLAKGALHRIFREELGLRADLELCARIMGDRGMTRDAIAGLARLVSKAADDGDAAAAAILDTAGAELAAIARALRHTLGFPPEEQAPLSWSGGVLTQEPIVRDALIRRLDSAGGFAVTAPRHDPDYGAALYARLLGDRAGSTTSQRREERRKCVLPLTVTSIGAIGATALAAIGAGHATGPQGSPIVVVPGGASRSAAPSAPAPATRTNAAARPAALTPAKKRAAQATWWKPAVADTWQWQISGKINTAYDVKIYDIDLFDAPDATIALLHAQNRKVLCYFSAGSSENWRPDFDEFQASDLGKPLDGWAGERWLDVRSQNFKRIMGERLDRAVQRGCDGVEPDNVDGYANKNGVGLSAPDQLAYNQFLATEAHRRGLAVGLKNDLDQVGALVNAFDFAVNEQCNQYRECDRLRPFTAAAKPIFNAEYAAKYRENTGGARDALCRASRAASIRTLVLPLNLNDKFRFSCD